MAGKRQMNFSDDECQILVENVQMFKDILQGSFSDACTKDQRKTVWKMIVNKVNATGKCPRTVEQLQKKWTDLKCRAKKSYSSYKKECQKTGGGSNNVKPPNALEEKVISIMGPEACNGVNGGIDHFSENLAKSTANLSGTPKPAKKRLFSEVDVPIASTSTHNPTLTRTQDPSPTFPHDFQMYLSETSSASSPISFVNFDGPSVCAPSPPPEPLDVIHARDAQEIEIETEPQTNQENITQNKKQRNNNRKRIERPTPAGDLSKFMTAQMEFMKVQTDFMRVQTDFMRVQTELSTKQTKALQELVQTVKEQNSILINIFTKKLS